MLTGTQRRQEIVNQIKSSETPVPGKELARMYEVSRQVIVQDIALIRASGHDILSTNRGYILNAPSTVSRIFKVSHTDEQVEDELTSIVDLGGTVVNVMINHKLYGRIEAGLRLNSRRKVEEFMTGLRTGKSSPLKNITSNYHYHTIEADSEHTLDIIEKMLRKKGFLVET